MPEIRPRVPNPLVLMEIRFDNHINLECSYTRYYLVKIFDISIYVLNLEPSGHASSSMLYIYKIDEGSWRRVSRGPLGIVRGTVCCS